MVSVRVRIGTATRSLLETISRVEVERLILCTSGRLD